MGDSQARGLGIKATRQLKESSARIAEILATLESVSASISTINGSVADLESDVGVLNTSLGTLSGDLSALDTELSGLASDLSTLESTVQSLQGNVSGADGDISALSGRVSALESDVNTLENNVGTLQSDVGALKRNTSNLLSHVMNKWEQGGRYVESGNLVAHANRIRTIDAFPIDPSTDHVISRGTSNTVFIYVFLFNASGAFTRSVTVNKNLGEMNKTFTTSSTETQCHVVLGDDVPVSPINAGGLLRAKIELGSQPTAWSPKPSDAWDEIINQR